MHGRGCFYPLRILGFGGHLLSVSECFFCSFLSARSHTEKGAA
jgi:hypothetical protein